MDAYLWSQEAMTVSDKHNEDRETPVNPLKNNLFFLAARCWLCEIYCQEMF